METQDFSDAEKCLVSCKTKTKYVFYASTAQKLDPGWVESKVQANKQARTLKSNLSRVYIEPVSDIVRVYIRQTRLARSKDIELLTLKSNFPRTTTTSADDSEC